MSSGGAITHNLDSSLNINLFFFLIKVQVISCSCTSTLPETCCGSSRRRAARTAVGMYMVCRGIFGILGFWLANFHSFGRRQQRSKYALYSFGAEPRDNCADGIQDCSYHHELQCLICRARFPTDSNSSPGECPSQWHTAL